MEQREQNIQKSTDKQTEEESISYSVGVLQNLLKRRGILFEPAYLEAVVRKKSPYLQNFEEFLRSEHIDLKKIQFSPRSIGCNTVRELKLLKN